MGDLELSQSGLDRYNSLFTKTKKLKPLIIAPHKHPEPDGSTRWHTGRWNWTEMSVLRHFAGKVALGLFWHNEVDHLMLDFDTHKRRSIDEVKDTVRKTVGTLPGEWLLYQSSFSQGIRAVCFLDKRYPLHQAKIVLDVWLKEAGFTTKLGIIENRMSLQGDRLPFGKGSMLLDPDSLEPMIDLNLPQTIAYVFDFARQNRLVIDNIAKIAGESEPNLRKKDEAALIQRLENEGLKPGETANDAFLLFNRHLQGGLGYSPEKTALWLKKWIREKHNGECGRITDGNFKDVDTHIDRIVADFDIDEYRGRPAAALSAGLPFNDIKTLVFKTRDYKILKASYNLLLYTSRKLLNKGNLNIARKSTGVIYVSRNLCDICCQIPWKTLRKLDGFPRNDPGRMMAELERLGIIKLKANYSTYQQRCREYWILFPFSQEPSPAATSLEAGLARIMSEKELRKTFGAYYAKKIIDAAGQAEAEGKPKVRDLRTEKSPERTETLHT